MTFSRLWIGLFILGFVPLLLSGLFPIAYALAILYYLFLAALVAADALLTPTSRTLTVSLEVVRDVDEKLSLGADNLVQVRVHNGTGHSLALEIRDTPPEAMGNDLNGLPLYFEIPARSRHIATYHVRPTARGDYDFGDIYLRMRGRLGMIHRLHHVPAATSVKVYPNLQDVERYNLLARRGRLQEAGIRKARLQGVGREFESLRDYQPDDELRRIDWKATARRGSLVSRQYEVERAQTVMLVMDVGRTMLAEVDGIQKIDYAINAALMLAHVATDSDDNVGLLVFADTLQTYLPPRKGRAQVHAILEALHNTHATLVESDYLLALSHLRSRFRKRALMVCFTDLWDPDSSRSTIEELASLQPRHVVATVTVLDTKLQRIADHPPTSVPATYEKAIAIQVLQDRQRALATLTQRGIQVVDSPAEKLSAELVNRYLQIKAQGKI